MSRRLLQSLISASSLMPDFCLYVVNRQLLPIDLDADIVIGQPADGCVENILVGLEGSDCHPKEWDQEAQSQQC